METIRGTTSHFLDFDGLHERIRNYSRIITDLGTGDGRYVRFLADRHPDWFVIGVDACRENLEKYSRAQLPNVLFVIASAQNLPQEFNGLISHITINFPWGSLLESLLVCDPSLMNGLAALAHGHTGIDIHLNSGALAEAGTTLDTGTQQIFESLAGYGWKLETPRCLDHHALREFPTTWAKRLAYGRDPRAMAVKGTLSA